MQLFSKNEILTWIGIGGLLLLPTFFAIPFTFPQADDYGYAELALNHSWIGEFTRLYTEWSGRYTSIIMGFLSPLAFGKPALYSSVIFLLLILFVFSSFLLFKTLTHQFKSNAFALVCSLLFSAVYFNLIPSPGESIYWYSGLITYILPTAFFSISVYFWGLFYKGKTKLTLVPASVFLLLSLGGNEILSTCVLLISLLLLWVLKRTSHSGFNSYSRVFILVLIGFGIMMVAPGNAVRKQMFDNQTSLMNQLLMTDIQLFRFGFTWLSNVSTWILFTFAIFIGQFAKQKEYSLRILNSIPPLFFILLPIAFLYISIFPAYLTMGMLGQQRTLAPGLFLFLIWIILYGVRMGYNSHFLSLLVGLFGKYLKFISLIFVGVMLFSGNNKVIINDLFANRFESYFQQNLNRSKQIKEAADNKEKTVFLEQFKDTPESFNVMDLKSDSSHWINQNWARYYDLKVVKSSK